MIELKHGPNKPVDLPYLVRVYGVTEQQFEELVDEDTRAELLDGVMIVHSPASIEHDDLGGFVRSLMRIYASRRRLGKVLGPDSLVQLKIGRWFAPDSYFVERKRAPLRKVKRFRGVPNLALEILSPTNRGFDLDEKLPAYQRAGVDEIWLIDPARRQVVIHRRQGRRYAQDAFSSGRGQSEALAGFWMEASWLWQDPLPDELDCLQAILES
jgi:Uma2 family endonuclease